jgi:hypothetical protein
VYVYRLVDDFWQAQEPIDAPRYANYFGTTLSVSGKLLAVGAPGSLGCPDGVTGAVYRGTVYVIAERDGRWSSADAQCLLPGTDDGVLFGWSLALEGNRLIVGAPLDSSGSHEVPRDTSATASGAVHWFEGTTSGDFREHRYLKSRKITAFGGFGASLALAPGLLAIGAPTEPVQLSGSSPGPSLSLAEAGAVYVFRGQP